jgi:hypothetical protein
MSQKRQEFLNKILDERERQINLPGSEYDLKNTPAEWLAIATHYLHREVFRSGRKPNAEEFQDGMIKAGAVILAALENINNMKSKRHFDGGDELT